MLTGLPDVHGHSDGQAEDSRCAFLPKGQKEDYNIYRIIIIAEVSDVEFILLLFVILPKLRYLA